MLKVPQYRLKDIEKTSIKRIQLNILERYVDLLGIRDLFDEWVKKNKDIYQHISDNKKEK